MKQMRSILAPLLMLLTGVLMTSCDDEQETAMMLWGTWEGQLSTEFYQDRWGGYGQTYYTVWHFEGKPGSRHGKGWEIDYVGHQRYAQHFDWQVIDDGRTVLCWRMGRRVDLQLLPRRQLLHGLHRQWRRQAVVLPTGARGGQRLRPRLRLGLPCAEAAADQGNCREGEIGISPPKNRDLFNFDVRQFAYFCTRNHPT